MQSRWEVDVIESERPEAAAPTERAGPPAPAVFSYRFVY